MREVGVSITSELLTPQPKLRDYSTHGVASSVRPQYERWERNVGQLYSLAKERRAALFAATQELQLYLVSIVLTHVGGNGIEDGQITVTLEQPFEFRINKQRPPDHDPYRYEPDRTQWHSVTDTPSAKGDNSFRKSYSFGNFHPGKTLTCDPLYIYLNPELKPAKNNVKSVLTVEISGLNVRVPISEVVTVQPV